MIKRSKDHYSGGMVMPERSFSYENYGFGFNRMTKDDEIKGSGNSSDFGARIYDPRLSKWLSIDPLQKEFPNLSPYNFGGCNPILMVDKDGRKIFIFYIDQDGNSQIFPYEPGIELPNNQYVQDAVKSIEHLMIVKTNSQSVGYVIEGIVQSQIKNVYLIDAATTIYETETIPIEDPWIQDVNNVLIKWDPYIGAAIVDRNNKLTGEKQSPSTVLGHELSHAFDFFNDGLKTIKNKFTKVPYFGNQAEQDAVTGEETEIANFFKEGTRNTILIKSYPSIGPTSTMESTVADVSQGKEVYLNHTDNVKWK